MRSIRSRLALYYAFALTVTMIAFGASVYWERITTAPREAELDMDRRLVGAANLAAQTLHQQAGVRQALIDVTADSGGESSRVLATDVSAYLDPSPDYIFVADTAGRIVYVSPPARALPAQVFDTLGALMIRRPPPQGIGEFAIGEGLPPLRYDLVAVDAARDIGSVMVAAPLVVDAGHAQQMLLSMLMIAPVILVASGTLGYWLAGRAMRPVEVMITELGDVQDGTSLNRRLAVPLGDDELSRLAQKLNEMLARVERSFVALRRFTADASHELKTPLMVLRAGVERSLTHPHTPGDIVPALDETLRQINQMSELVTNLLILARADEGRASLAMQEVDLRTLVSEAGETAEILGDAREISVQIDLPGYPVPLAVDAGRIRQLLMNLVTNAIKYTPAGGKVLARLVDTPEQVSIVIQDNGIGIAPGDLPNVFERFWRADLARSRTGEHPGTGLGLAITKWIAEAHGGTVTVQSRPARGSTFTVVLPKEVASRESRVAKPGPQ